MANQSGTFEGFSSNYSGAGFSHMRFRVRATDAAGFDAWVQEARAGGERLDRARYLALEKPSEREPARVFAGVENGLYAAILNRCVDPRRMCMHEMMAIDAAGGLPAADSGLTVLQDRSRGDLRGRPFVPSQTCSADAVRPAWTLALSAP